MSEAIALAIQNNLTSKLARAGTEEARGVALQKASGLLPQVMGTVQEARVFKVNLEAQGFPGDSPLFSPLLGPFNSFDARLTLVQNILDFKSIYHYKLGQAKKRVAELDERLAREQVAAAAALVYLEAQRTRRATSTPPRPRSNSRKVCASWRRTSTAPGSARVWMSPGRKPIMRWKISSSSARNSLPSSPISSSNA